MEGAQIGDFVPGSVTDTEYRGISKYRYRSRYSKYQKTVNRYFNFVNTTPRDQSLRPFWRPTQPDWIISTIRLFRNCTQNCLDYSIFPVVASLHSIYSSSYLRHRDLRSVSTTRVHGPSWRVSKNAPEFSGRQLGPWTRPVNSGSGNRP